MVTNFQPKGRHVATAEYLRTAETLFPHQLKLEFTATASFTKSDNNYVKEYASIAHMLAVVDQSNVLIKIIKLKWASSRQDLLALGEVKEIVIELPSHGQSGLIYATCTDVEWTERNLQKAKDWYDKMKDVTFARPRDLTILLVVGLILTFNALAFIYGASGSRVGS